MNTIKPSDNRRTNPLYSQIMQISRAIEARLMHRLSGTGYQDLTMNLGPPLMLISTGKYRLNTLASKLGMSNQQCNQSLKPLERMGIIERQPDASDARAKLIVLSEKGKTLIKDAYEGVEHIAEEFEQIMGKEQLNDLNVAITAFCQAVNLIGPVDQSLPFVGLAGMSSRYLEKRLMELTKSQGHKYLQMSFSQVLGFMPMDKGIGITISELALQNKVSIQAISRIANELETLGYISRVTDEHDKRIRRMQLTDRGHTLMLDSICSTHRLDEELAKLLGEGMFDQLKTGIDTLYKVFLKPQPSPAVIEQSSNINLLVDYISAYSENPAHIRNSDFERKLLAHINTGQLAALQSIVNRLNDKTDSVE